MSCPTPTGTVVTHTTDITADEHWAGDGTLHKVGFSITIRPGATLTLDPCAVVQIAAGLSIIVAGDVATSRPAKLLAQGTLNQPVNIGRVDGAASWSDIRALSPQSLVDLSFTTVSGGGGSNSVTHPMLWLRGAGGTTTVSKTLRLVDVVFDSSDGLALQLESQAALSDDSANLTISRSGGNGAGIVQITPLGLNTLPRSFFTRENLLNEIKVKDGSLIIERDVTVKNLGVSYHFVFDRVRVHSKTATPTFTVEPGVTLRFDDYLVLGFDNPSLNDFEPGRLIATGGPGSQQITFTGAKATPAAGNWPGIFLEDAPGSHLENVVIEQAGGFNGIGSANCKPGNTSDHAALFIGGKDIPYLPAASDFVNVTIKDSASHGINAMWQASGFGPDLTAGFTFTNINGCRQTKNGRPTGCGNEAGCLVP